MSRSNYRRRESCTCSSTTRRPRSGIARKRGGRRGSLTTPNSNRKPVSPHSNPCRPPRRTWASSRTPSRTPRRPSKISSARSASPISRFNRRPDSPGRMHPILFHLGSFEIHTYGVLVAIGFLLGIVTAAQRAKSEGIDPERINDLGVWLIVTGMAGGKLFHIVFFWNEFMQGLREAGINSLRDGFVLYGGFICAALTTVVYTRARRLPLAKIADAFAPSIALGHMFGRLGCFFEGCCYGKACALPWAVKFPAFQVSVHPDRKSVV